MGLSELEAEEVWAAKKLGGATNLELVFIIMT